MRPITAEPDVEAKPKDDPGTWVTPEDYPKWALREDVEGVVRFRLIVDEQGKAKDCQITESSGIADLDSTACAKLLERAEFTPALDKSGRRLLAAWNSAVSWQIPGGRRPFPKEGY